MNVKNLLSTIAVAGLLVACNDYDPGLSDTVMDNTDEELATLTAYTRNFVNRYGSISKEQTWGFGELAELKTRYSSPNDNQWHCDRPAGYAGRRTALCGPCQFRHPALHRLCAADGGHE